MNFNFPSRSLVDFTDKKKLQTKSKTKTKTNGIFGVHGTCTRIFRKREQDCYVIRIRTQREENQPNNKYKNILRNKNIFLLSF